MKPEQQRIAIAEACPATFELNNGRYKTPFFIRYMASGHECDPLNDLNAMHEAESKLEGMNTAEFAVQLCRVVGKDWPSGRLGGGSFAHIHATATQRAEAFLRTIGKWEDDKCF